MAALSVALDCIAYLVVRQQPRSCLTQPFTPWGVNGYAMTVIDTDSAIWYLGRSPELSSTAQNATRAAIKAGEPEFISALSVAEVTYLVEIRTA